MYKVKHNASQPHVDDSEKVKIEIGNRISIWRPFVFRNRK